MKRKIIKKFTKCDYAFYPYIEKVLKRLSKEVRDSVLDSKDFQMISFDAWGQHFDFENPI